MTTDCLKLTIYFGESDRVEGHLLSDVLVDRFAAAGVRAAVLLRAAEGFGVKQQLHTQRLLTLSEDLPLVAVAVDRRETIEMLVHEIQPLVGGGLITLERARLLEGELLDWPGDLQDEAKLTVYLGRTAPYVAAVELLRSHGLDGATAFLGVDGMTAGRRARARFFSRNASVPLVIVATGRGAAVAAALQSLRRLTPGAVTTLERVRVCRRDGVLLAEPRHLPERDDAGLPVWQKLTVYAPEDATHEGHSLYLRLIHRLREEGATGATALRGIWGYSGRRPPHGDTLLSVRRRVPMMTVVVDAPDAIQRWWQVIEEVTDETGVVTSELVPAFHAIGPSVTRGGLRLSRLRL